MKNAVREGVAVRRRLHPNWRNVWGRLIAIDHSPDLRRHLVAGVHRCRLRRRLGAEYRRFARQTAKLRTIAVRQIRKAQSSGLLCLIGPNEFAGNLKSIVVAEREPKPHRPPVHERSH
jgi:hypothetical protein